jgi:hypothetical protein
MKKIIRTFLAILITLGLLVTVPALSARADCTEAPGSPDVWTCDNTPDDTDGMDATTNSSADDVTIDAGATVNNAPSDITTIDMLDGTLTNNGTVSNNEVSGAAIFASGDSDITNNGAVYATGDSGTAIFTVSGDVTNGASVQADGLSATGILTDTGNVVNDGTVTTNGASGIGILTDTGNNAVTNNGTVSATGSGGIAILTGSGNDTVTIGSGATVNGVIDGGADNDTLVFDGITQSQLAGLNPAAGTFGGYSWVSFEQLSGSFPIPQFAPMGQWTTDYSYNAQQWRVQFHPRLTGDVDGDGDDDIVGFGYDRVLVALSNGVNGFAPMTQWTTDFSYNLQQWRVEFHPRLLGDVNGDGKADIVGFGYDRVLVALSTGTSFAPMTQWTIDFSLRPQGWRVEKHPRLLGDVDGDGDDDIIGFGNDRVLVALSNGVNGFAPMTQWTTDYSYNAQQWRVEFHPRIVGDVNGDGKADIVGFGYDRVLVALSTGTSFAPMTQWTTDFSYNAQQWRVEYHPRLLGDVNGDGMNDLVGFGYDRVLVALSNGTSFLPMYQATTDYSYNAQQWRVEFHPRLTGDFNGDGWDDLIGFGYDRVLVALSK